MRGRGGGGNLPNYQRRYHSAATHLTRTSLSLRPAENSGWPTTRELRVAYYTRTIKLPKPTGTNGPIERGEEMVRRNCAKSLDREMRINGLEQMAL